jgi:hypothetical protein
VKADFNEMTRHLQLLFGGCAEGMIEIAYGCPAPNKAMLTDVRGLEQLAGEALLQNGRGYNTYVGACVRHPHTAPFGRANDRDVICAPAIVVDLDEQGRAENAPKLWDDTPPSFCVVTGLHPHKRMQMWWLLDQPMLSLEIWSSLQRAMAAKYDGDTTVTNPSRIMRLAGSVAQPVKEGRVLEPTFLENVRDPLPRYSVGQITEHCEQFLGEPTNGVGVPAPPQHATPTNSLGLSNGAKLTDGREHYMRDTVLACLREFIGTHGAAPDAQELFDAVWPQYEQHVAIEVPGKKTRGSDEVFAKCVSTLQRFHRGEISSMRDLDAAIARHQQRHETYATEAAPALQPQQSQSQLFELKRLTLRQLDEHSIPERDWLYGTDYIRGYTSCTVAPGAAGKSSLLTVEALAMASGKPLLGITPKGQLGVFMWNGEDPLEEIERRVYAAMRAYGLTHEDIGGRLYVGSGRDVRLKLITNANRTTQIDTGLVNHLATQLASVDVMILDPLVAIHNVTENDNVAVDALVKEIDGISERAHIATMLAHHSRKTNGNEVSVEDARGASALLFAVRSGRVINTMSQDEAARLGIKHRRRHFRLENGKLNMAPPPEKADWFELKGQPLYNGPMGIGGDNVAVVFQWQLPDVMDGFTGGDVDRALAELRSGTWHADAQASRWGGQAVARVFGLDLNDDASRARVKGMLRQWERNGPLRRVRKLDPLTRHERTFYAVIEEAGG